MKNKIENSKTLFVYLLRHQVAYPDDVIKAIGDGNLTHGLIHYFSRWLNESSKNKNHCKVGQEYIANYFGKSDRAIRKVFKETEWFGGMLEISKNKYRPTKACKALLDTVVEKKPIAPEKASEIVPWANIEKRLFSYIDDSKVFEPNAYFYKALELSGYKFKIGRNDKPSNDRIIKMHLDIKYAVRFYIEKLNAKKILQDSDFHMKSFVDSLETGDFDEFIRVESQKLKTLKRKADAEELVMKVKEWETKQISKPEFKEWAKTSSYQNEQINSAFMLCKEGLLDKYLEHIRNEEYIYCFDIDEVKEFISNNKTLVSA